MSKNLKEIKDQSRKTDIQLRSSRKREQRKEQEIKKFLNHFSFIHMNTEHLVFTLRGSNKCPAQRHLHISS